MKAVGRFGVKRAVLGFEGDTKGLKAGKVHVDLTGADLAAARHSHDCAAETTDKRT